MPFVQAKCPECGGMLAVDNSKKAAICQFCGNAFVVEEAVNNYITNNITNNNFGAGAVVNIYADSEKDFVIEAGVLTKYKGASADVVIPDTVSKIGNHCFANSNIKSVVIPNSVNEIEYYAFEHCKSLTSITIPNSVTSIGSSAFSGSGLTSITIPNSVTRFFVDYAFSGCYNLTSIKLPSSITRIGKSMFYSCSSLTSITIPSGITEICDNAFSWCDNLSSIYIPPSVSTIHKYAFLHCNKLKAVVFEDAPLFLSAFKDTPYYEQLRMKEEQQAAQYRSKGLCQYCGGTFKGLFSKTCTVCGKLKDY